MMMMMMKNFCGLCGKLKEFSSRRPRMWKDGRVLWKAAGRFPDGTQAFVGFIRKSTGGTQLSMSEHNPQRYGPQA